MNSPRVGFLGLGIMGAPMARRLLSAGFPLTVYNRNPEKAAALVAAGAHLAVSPRTAAAAADLVICMVADDTASRAMWGSDAGALAGANPGAVLIESSTLSVPWVQELADIATKRGFAFLDAPVTGSKQQASAGELNFIVGGPAPALERARPALSAMGRSITHLGPAGSGALVKLINNFVCGVQVASIAEALAWIERSELDRAKALAVLTEGAPGSPLVKTVTSRMTSGDFTPNFLLRLMTKDLTYAAAEAGRRGLKLGSAAAAREAFQQAIAAGQGEKDMSAVIAALRPKPPAPPAAPRP